MYVFGNYTELYFQIAMEEIFPGQRGPPREGLLGGPPQKRGNSNDGVFNYFVKNQYKIIISKPVSQFARNFSSSENY